MSKSKNQGAQDAPTEEEPKIETRVHSSIEGDGSISIRESEFTVTPVWDADGKETGQTQMIYRGKAHSKMLAQNILIGGNQGKACRLVAAYGKLQSPVVRDAALAAHRQGKHLGSEMRAALVACIEGFAGKKLPQGSTKTKSKDTEVASISL